MLHDLTKHTRSAMLGLMTIGMTVVSGLPHAHAAAAPSFEKDIGPILVKRCSTCHGEKRQKNGLRLDSAEAVKKGSDNGPIYVAGKADMSEIIRRTTLPEGDSDRMPAKGAMLTKAQTDAIKEWINAGAKFE